MHLTYNMVCIANKQQTVLLAIPQVSLFPIGANIYSSKYQRLLNSRKHSPIVSGAKFLVLCTMEINNLWSDLFIQMIHKVKLFNFPFMNKHLYASKCKFIPSTLRTLHTIEACISKKFPLWERRLWLILNTT